MQGINTGFQLLTRTGSKATLGGTGKQPRANKKTAEKEEKNETQLII